MTWFKVDDTLAHHAKVLAAGNAAVGLWVRAGAWSMQQLTDGHVPAHVAATLGTKSEAKRLVGVGLWLEVEGGYQFHQWTDVQRTKEQVKADRDAATERQRRAREAAKSRSESRRDTGVSHGPPVSQPPDQTRPDQTSSSYGTTPPEVEPDKPAKRDKRATQLPSDFKPNDTNRRIAAERGINLDDAVENFVDWHLSKASKFVDWHRALNTWLRKERPNPRLVAVPTGDPDDPADLPPVEQSWMRRRPRG